MLSFELFRLIPCRCRGLGLEGLQRHGAVVIEELFTHFEEIGRGVAASNPMQELAFCIHADSEEVHVLLHPLNTSVLGSDSPSAAACN